MGKIPAPVPDVVKQSLQARLRGREHAPVTWSMYFQRSSNRAVFVAHYWMRVGAVQQRSEYHCPEFYANGESAE